MRRVVGFVLLVLSISCGAKTGFTYQPYIVAVEQITTLYPYPVLLTETKEPELRMLEAQLRRWGVALSYDANLTENEGFVGVTKAFLNLPVTVTLDSRLTIDGQYEVLAHEAAHLFMLKKDYTKIQAEVVAEAISYRMCDRVGLSNLAASTHYVKKLLLAEPSALGVLKTDAVFVENVFKWITGEQKVPVEYLTQWAQWKGR